MGLTCPSRRFREFSVGCESQLEEGFLGMEGLGVPHEQLFQPLKNSIGNAVPLPLAFRTPPFLDGLGGSPAEPER